MKKDKILKSSLSTLLKRFSSTDVVSTFSKEYSVSSPSNVPLDRIQDNSVLKAARINEEKLSRICSLITEKGVPTPLYIKQVQDGYEVLYPRSLYKAARKCKFESLPCVLINIDENDELLFLASRLLQDRDANIIEMSLIFNRIKKKMNYSQKEIAQAMNLSRPQVTNIMRLFNLPQSILRDVVDGKLSFGHVRALSTLKEEEMLELVNEIYDKHLSVHQVEKIVYERKHQTSFSKDDDKLSKKYKCKVNSNAKRVTFIFDDEKEKEKFISKISH